MSEFALLWLYHQFSWKKQTNKKIQKPDIDLLLAWPGPKEDCVNLSFLENRTQGKYWNTSNLMGVTEGAIPGNGSEWKKEERP